MIEKEFISYTLALELKSLGFDEPCFGCYDEKTIFGLTVMSIKQYYTNSKEDTWNCAAPLYQQAFRWFREKYNIDGLLHKTAEGSYYFWITECEYENYNHYKYYNQMVYFKTHEEAELACLNNLIEIVKSKSE